MTKKINAKPIILIDGSSYFYRAFHALPPLMNSKGQPTGAIYGVINMIRRLIKDYDPECVAVVFDPKGKTHRNDIFSEYKANRPPMPSDLVVQINALHEIIKAMGLPLLIIEGIEADDVIGTLAQQAKASGTEVIISTGDKDLTQLVNHHITIINTMNDVTLDRQGVINKFGVPPEKMVDYLALIGDKIDNIPGVPNVGPKTAVKWLQEYGSIEGIIKNVEHIKGKIGETLKQNIPQLLLSKELVTISTSVPLPIHFDQLHREEPDQQKLIEFFTELEFKSWLSEALQQEVTQLNVDYEIILTQASLEKWCKQLHQAQRFAISTKRTHSDVSRAELVGISFAINQGKAGYLPFMHEDETAQLNKDYVLNCLKDILQDKSKIIIGHNLKNDIILLSKHEIFLQAQLYDVNLESYLLNSATSKHDLESLALKYLGQRTLPLEEIAGKGSKQLSFELIRIENAAPFAAENADVILQLHDKLWSLLQQNPQLTNLYDTIEMPLARVLAHMETHGVMIDAAKLNKQSKELAKRVQQLEDEAYTLAGEKFNLGSPKQLQTILFEKLQLPVTQKTPTGQPSTSEAVLQELALDFPLPKVILEYRSLSKLKSTYTDTLPLQINERTGRIHTCYNQTVTTTGRLSSTEPNLQNIPIRNDEGRKIRQAFVPPPGYKIVSADYSQIELRIMAHFSQDETLIKAFEQNLDIHKATAAEVFNVGIESVTSLQRRSAKAINFGLIYGMSAFGLGRALNIDRNIAQDYIELYFQRYPGVKQYMERTRQLAHRQGYVETLHGRRLYLPDINASNLQRQKAAERAAINAPLQGTAADFIKLAMIKLDAWLAKKHIAGSMIMQVHDELVFEVAEKDAPLLLENIKECMTSVAQLSVPLMVDVGIGANWDEAH